MKLRNGFIGMAALALAACGGDEPETAAPETAAAEPAETTVQTWRIGLEEIEGSVQYEYGAKFAELINEKTDGEVEVKLFPYGQLGGLTDIYDQVQAGAIELAIAAVQPEFRSDRRRADQHRDPQ